MRVVILLRMLAVSWVALLASAGGAALAQAQAAVAGGAGWSRPAYGPFPPYPYAPYPYLPYAYGPYPYGGYSPWGPCVTGACFGDMEVRRAVRREMQVQELRRELDAQASGAAAGSTGSIHPEPRYLPPPTPESHLQPAYRGTGDVRAEYRGSGQAR
jgi:hypothetical protein